MSLVWAQNSADITIPVNVVRARMDVRVALKDSAGSVRDLDASDFAIFENGRRAVMKGADLESCPLDLILMLDVSDSMNHVTEDLVRAANELAASFSAGDRVAVVEFGGKIVAQSPFTSDKLQISRSIQHARGDVGKAEGATAIYDSVVKALDLFEGPAPADRRRAVLVVTDDIDNQSHDGAQEVIRSVLEKDAVLNAVVIGSPLTTLTKAVYKIGPSRFILPPKSLKPIALETGGEFLAGHSAATLLKTALDQIRSRYLLTYVPSEPAAECVQVEAELSKAAKSLHPHAIVRGPRYRVGKAGAPCKW